MYDKKSIKTIFFDIAVIFIGSITNRMGKFSKDRSEVTPRRRPLLAPIYNRRGKIDK
jgi:hypothetical protein